MTNRIAPFITEMRKNSEQPVRLEARNFPAFGGWFLCRQSGVTMGEPFKSHEAALAFHSKAWVKAWDGY